MTAELKPLLSAEDLARLVGRPIKTIYEWSYKGVGGPPALKLGRKLAYDPDDVAAWIALQRKPQRETA